MDLTMDRRLRRWRPDLRQAHLLQRLQREIESESSIRARLIMSSNQEAGGSRGDTHAEARVLEETRVLPPAQRYGERESHVARVIGVASPLQARPLGECGRPAVWTSVDDQQSRDISSKAVDPYHASAFSWFVWTRVGMSVAKWKG
jgi:hypothetical protein